MNGNLSGTLFRTRSMMPHSRNVVQFASYKNVKEKSLQKKPTAALLLCFHIMNTAQKTNVSSYLFFSITKADASYLINPFE